MVVVVIIVVVVVVVVIVAMVAIGSSVIRGDARKMLGWERSVFGGARMIRRWGKKEKEVKGVCLMRQTGVGVAATGHGEVGRVSVGLPDLRGSGEFAVNLRGLGESVMTGQGPGLRVQVHRREPLDERIVRGRRDGVQQPDTVVMRGQSGVRREGGMELGRDEGVSRHRAAAPARPSHLTPGHAVRRVRQRHRRAMRVSDHWLSRVMGQSRGRSVHADVVAFRERRHSHVGRPTERFLVGIQRIR